MAAPPRGYHDQMRWLPLIPNNYTSGPLICLQTGDIAKWSRKASTDAIVNPGNEHLLGGGRYYEAIHNAAGPELRNAILAIPAVPPRVRCSIGEAKITRGYKLPATHVIHTVEPIYGSDANPKESLRKAYRSCLSLAKANSIEYVAFPAMSCNTSSHPVEEIEAAVVAFSVVKEEFATDFKQVHFVFTSDDIYKVWHDKGVEMFDNGPSQRFYFGEGNSIHFM